MRNINKKTWISSKIVILGSSIDGRGIFAKSDIRKGEKLIVWGCNYTDKAGAEEAIKRGWPVMQWDDDLFSYDNGENHDEYSINHSCDSNMWMSDAFTLSARKDIYKGDELTVDYALLVSDENYISPWDCNCKSSLCRGRATGKDWQNPQLQERYKGHFSPLLNKRIAKFNLEDKDR